MAAPEHGRNFHARSGSIALAYKHQNTNTTTKTPSTPTTTTMRATLLIVAIMCLIGTAVAGSGTLRQPVFDALFDDELHRLFGHRGGQQHTMAAADSHCTRGALRSIDRKQCLKKTCTGTCRTYDVPSGMCLGAEGGKFAMPVDRDPASDIDAH